MKFVSKALSYASQTALLMVSSQKSMVTHTWADYHWARDANPFTLQVIDSTTAEWDSQLRESLNMWSTSSVLNLVTVSENGSSQATCMDYSTSDNSQWPNDHDFAMMMETMVVTMVDQ